MSSSECYFIFIDKMIKRHSDLLNKHMSSLVENTNLEELVPKLVSNNVFTHDMVNRILNSPEQSEKLRSIDLFLNVAKRGPFAFTGLITALTESGHSMLAQELQRADDMERQRNPFFLPLNGNMGESSSSSQQDSPDSSPTHTCRIPHSTHPFVLPDYMNELSDAFRNTHNCPDDMVQLSELAGSLPVFVKRASDLKTSDGRLPEKYRMTSNPRGYALIINNYQFDDPEFPTRNGSQNDERAMRELLEQLYFRVEPHVNKKRLEMVRIVEQFAAKTDWQIMDCAFVVLMSHGKEGDSEEDTEIIGTDGLGFKTRDIISYFYNDSCPALLNKPKIFIFQSCRGSLTDSGVEVNLFNEPMARVRRTEHDGRAQRKDVRHRSRSDIFIAHPVPPGIKANRDRYSGAWFIQTIANVFAEYALSHDLDEMFKIVDHKIKRMVNKVDTNFQTVVCRAIGWNKKLYFNPGLHFSEGKLIKALTEDGNGMDVVDTPAESQMNGKKSEDQQPLTRDDEEPSGCFRCQPF